MEILGDLDLRLDCFGESTIRLAMTNYFNLKIDSQSIRVSVIAIEVMAESIRLKRQVRKYLEWISWVVQLRTRK